MDWRVLVKDERLKKQFFDMYDNLVVEKLKIKNTVINMFIGVIILLFACLDTNIPFCTFFL